MMNIYTLFACYRMKNLKAPKGAKYMNSFICRFIWHETTTIISKPYDAALDKGNLTTNFFFYMGNFKFCCLKQNTYTSVLIRREKLKIRDKPVIKMR